MLPLYALNQLFSVSDRKWTSLTLKLSKLIQKYWKPCVFLKNTSNLLWEMLTLLLSDKHTLRFPILSGRTLEDYKKQKNSYKK